MWQIVANLEFVTGFAIDLQTRKPNISPRDMVSADTRKSMELTEWLRKNVFDIFDPA